MNGVLFGAGSTRRKLEAAGIMEKTPLELVTNDELRLHDKKLDMLGGWKRSFWHYGDACKGGVLIIAGTVENFKTWAASSACRDESAGVASGRLFVWVKHKPDDEYGYILALDVQNETSCATVANGKGLALFQNGTVYEGEF